MHKRDSFIFERGVFQIGPRQNNLLSRGKDEPRLERLSAAPAAAVSDAAASALGA